MGLPQRDDKRYTYADYCTWPDDVRYELIDGVAYAMTGPNRRHQEVVGELYFQIRQALDGKPCRPYLAPFDVRLPNTRKAKKAGDKTDTVVQPDISVFCERDKLDDKGAVGAPDWIIEVLSPTTAGHDHILKRRLYERVGVREYWLVHPVDKIVTIYVLKPEGYGAPEFLELLEVTPSRILPEVQIDWERVLREA